MTITHPSTTKESPAPLTMEVYRNAAFRAVVVQRIQAGSMSRQSPDKIAADIATEQRALAKAITQLAVIDVASASLLKAQAVITANPRYQSTPEQAHETMHQIMHRRAAEANRFAELLSQPHYVAQLAALSSAEANAAVPPLRDVKMSDVLGDLLHLENGAPQVIAHIEATAKGAMLEHDALAMAFAPDGALHDTLMKALAAELPTIDQPGIHAIVRDWLDAREEAAKLTSALSANDGAAYLEAVRRSTEWHRVPHDAPAAAILPATIIHQATLETQPSAREHEKEKDAKQRAEDIAYTINHALSCGTTDVVLQPMIAAAFGVNVGCGDPSHSHHHQGHGHFHHHPKPKLTLKTFAHEAGHYLKGEIIGDFVAVPLTIGVQRLFPNFMNGLRKIFEPLLSWAFHGGANRTARHWAKEQGIAEDAPEVQAHAEAIYEHEVSHLPQAVVWNMFAYPIGAVAQKMGGHGRSYPEIFKSKLVGALVSNGILIGGRVLAPGAAQKWDAMTGDKIFLPVSKTVGKLFGVDEETIEKAAEKQHKRAPSNWKKRVEDGQSQTKTDIGLPTP